MSGVSDCASCAACDVGGKELKHPRSCDTLWSSLCNHCVLWQPHEEGAEREACRHPFPRRVQAAFSRPPLCSANLLTGRALPVCSGRKLVSCCSQHLAQAQLGGRVSGALGPCICSLTRLMFPLLDGKNLIDSRHVLYGASRVRQTLLLAYHLCRLVCFLGCQPVVSPTCPFSLHRSLTHCAVLCPM